MGAWGYSALESDEGLGVKDWWETGEKLGHDSAKIIDIQIKEWGDAVNYGDSITNNEILATALICIDKNIDLSSKLKKITIDAINRELETIELARWRDPREREDALNNLLIELGGKRKKPQRYKIFSDSALEYKSVKIARNKLLKSYKKSQSKAHPISLSKAGFPEFISTIDRFMNSKLSEKDTSIFIESRKQRLMMLSTYLLLSLNKSDTELEKLFDQIDKWPES